jgi:predicted regulator of amino acid metabolism with ACT domain
VGAKGLWLNYGKSSKSDANMPNPARSASEVVRELIETDGVVRHGLEREIINIRALARSIRDSNREKLSFEAIVSAIRRYPLEKGSGSRVAGGRIVTKLSMKNKMVAVALRNQPEIPRNLARFSSEVDYSRGDTLRIVSGPEAVTLIMDLKNLEKLMSMIPRSNVLAVTKNLAEIIVQHFETIVRRPGIVAIVTTQLAVNDVNMLDCAATYGPPPQITIVVEEKDALRAYEALEKLSHP